MRSIPAQKFFIFCFLLIVSLHNFLTWQIIAVHCLVLVFSCFSYFRSQMVSKNGTAAFLSLVSVILFFALLPYLTSSQVEPDAWTAYLRLIWGCSIFVTFWLSFRSQISLQNVVDVLELVILIHVSFFLLQWAALTFLNLHIDPLQALGRAQRVYGGAGTGLFRPSGLFNEPGTYFACTSIMMYCRYFAKPLKDWLFFVTILTFFMSLSIQAIFVSVAFLIIITVSEKRLKLFSFRNVLVFMVIVILAAAFFLFYFRQYFVNRFLSGGEDITLVARLQALIHYWELDFEQKLSGMGVAVNECGCLLADTGLFFTIIYSFGLVGLALIILWIWSCRKRIVVAACVGFVLVSKVEITFSLFWLFLAFSICFRKKLLTSPISEGSTDSLILSRTNV